jgi:hypothetical protein
MNEAAARERQNRNSQKWSALQTYAAAIRAAASRAEVIVIEANIQADMDNNADASFVTRLSYLRAACGEKRNWDAYLFQQRPDEARLRAVERYINLALQSPQQQAAQGRQLQRDINRHIQNDSR